MGKKNMEIFRDGIFKNNPVIVQLVGLCSILGVSTSILNAVGMGISVIFVLTLSNVVISLLRNFIPDKIRIPSFIVVIATFVTLVDMLLNAFAPDLYSALGLFIPLIVVNCIILARAEGFASKFSVGKSLIDGISNGIGYTVAIVILAAIRELFGTGTFFGIDVFKGMISPIGIIAQPPGAFIILGFMIAVFNLYNRKQMEKASRKALMEQAEQGGNI